MHGVLPRCLALGLSSLALIACTDDAGTAPGGDPVPRQAGVYEGHYRVPVAAELEAAAIFPVPEVTWTVVGDGVRLHYDLPVGLVGGILDVTLVGTFEAGAREVVVSGEQGTGTCTAVGTVVSCREQFHDLGALPISMRVVEDTAAAEYAGPVSDREAVAEIFGGPDPIGIVDFDITRPSLDDHGGRDD
jgi:hypothetical protein